MQMRSTAKSKPPEQPKVAPRAPQRATAPLTPASAKPTAPRPLGTGKAAARAPLTPASKPAQEEHEEDQFLKPSAKATASRSAPLPPQKPPPLKQQIESYFSDAGLQSDQHLRELIDGSPGGWVDVDEILDLRRIKALKARKEDVIEALQESWLEIFESEDGISAAVRRPAVMPALPTRPSGVGPASSKRLSQPPSKTKTPPAKEPSAPPKAAGRTLFPGRLSGTLSSYDEESGEAFINCAQTEALFQKDVVISWQEMEQAGGALNIGSLVSFLVELGPTGEPQARDLKLRSPEEEDEEYYEEMMPAKKRKVVEEAVEGERYVGTLKHMQEDLGIGFLGCKEVHATYGRDVAVDLTEVSSFAIGDSLSFELAMDEMGTPIAIALEAVGEEDVFAKLVAQAEREFEGIPEPEAEETQAEEMMPPRAKSSAQPLTPPRQPGAPLKTLPGKAPAKGVGKGRPAEANGAPAKANGQLASDRVKLTAKAGAKAAAVRGPAPPKQPTGPPPAALEGRFTGYVKSANVVTGRGRIALTDKRPFPSVADVAVSEAELTGFVVGDGVSFGITRDAKTALLQAVDLEAV